MRPQEAKRRYEYFMGADFLGTDVHIPSLSLIAVVQEETDAIAAL